MPLSEEEARFLLSIDGFDLVDLLDQNFQIKSHIKYFQKTVYLKNNVSCGTIAEYPALLKFYRENGYWLLVATSSYWKPDVFTGSHV